jgi:hypothetical protein
MPHDTRASVGSGDAIASRRSKAANLGGRARFVPLPVLGDEHVADRFALPQGNLTERPAERALEEERDRLFDPQGTVGLDLDDDARLRKRERLRLCDSRRREEKNENEGEEPTGPQN